ncbi:MAG: hypothetical protein M3323_13830 [Actinomycetota bacterium]|nr:hypothetical protein [Actinomycetota bacterium]
MHWSLLAFGFATAVLAALRLLVLEEGSGVGRVADALWWALPLGWGFHQYAYRKVERYRLATDRWMARLRNPSMQWGIVYELEVRGRLATVGETAADAIEGASSKELARGSRDRVWDIGGHVVQLRVIPESAIAGMEQAAELRLAFRPVTNSLKAWQGIIEDKVLPLIRRVEEAARPYAIPGVAPKITVEIVYGQKNPYFGYFVTRVEPTAVARVDIEYFEHVADEDARIQVHEDRLEFVAPSLDSARRLSLRYLSLGEPRA